MTRTTAQRLGDVTLVLTAFAVMTLIARFLASIDAAHGSNDTLWSYFRLGADGALLPAFAASCLYGWMDRGRDRYARWTLFAVFALGAIGIVGSVFVGADSYRTLEGGASYLEDAASLLLAAGGFILLAGIGTGRDEG